MLCDLCHSTLMPSVDPPLHPPLSCPTACASQIVVLYSNQIPLSSFDSVGMRKLIGAPDLLSDAVVYKDLGPPAANFSPCHLNLNVIPSLPTSYSPPLREEQNPKKRPSRCRTLSLPCQ
ncbi:hypothetical protein FIBSPDRAFT_860530 [Athelia psychrophila]|uniref:Uncharacterized protein n=1 Tax=Athelia psychrophila TaxID=1759441 RepID=A0A166K6P2_9AGAM|nr:hypothetical protein FIBSPDRAFT_860530 [Fibularhizoctonia sp. CBS 109695]